MSLRHSVMRGREVDAVSSQFCTTRACKYSPLHLECHFFILKSQSIIEFSRSLLPRSVEKRPKEIEIGD